MILNRITATSLDRLLKLNRVVLNNRKNLTILFNKNINNNYASLFSNSVFLIGNNNKRYLSNQSTVDELNAKISSQEKQQQQQDGSQSQTETEQVDDEPFEDTILRNALKYVPEHGFTEEAISRAIIDYGLSSAAKGIFENGAFDLIDFFYRQSNNKMADYLENLVKENKILKKNELIREALLYRLSFTQPYIKHWPQAMAIMSFKPTYTLTSINNLIKLCDEIWHQCGDKSTDINWYTKRLSLAALYKSTELFMIQDKSENFQDTVKFLDNRLEELGAFNTVNRRINELYQAVTGSFTILKNLLNIRKF